jgi:hypothetical protein
MTQNREILPYSPPVSNLAHADKILECDGKLGSLALLDSPANRALHPRATSVPAVGTISRNRLSPISSGDLFVLSGYNCDTLITRARGNKPHVG